MTLFVSTFFYNPVIEYSDTDSMYIGQEYSPVMEKSGLVGNELGQFKNDYGEGLVIEEFLCIGKKCKICKLSNGEVKSTIKGYTGLKKLANEAKLELFECFKKSIESGSKEVFKEIKFETMKRNALQVNVIESTRSFKMTAYNQYKVDKDYKCYPLYYEL